MWTPLLAVVDTMKWGQIGARPNRAASKRRVNVDVPTEMFRHFFKSLCVAMRCNLHIEARGENNHHLIEGVFKAFARALKMAVRRDVFACDLPSSKGVL